MGLTSSEMHRYARHLPLIGQKGQARLLKAKVLCVGAGGLGAAVLHYLAASGIGSLGIIDGDQVELSNLQRQVIFNPKDIGKNKAAQADCYLKQFNPTLQTFVYETFLTEDNIEQVINDYKVIIDCTDNYRTHYLLNDICVKYKKSLVFSSIDQFRGQCSIFNYQGGPCYRCLYEIPPPEEMLIPNCALNGVLGVLPGILGCVQATETIKILLEKGNILSGRLLTLDALSMKFDEFQILKNPHCPCCYFGKSAIELFSKRNFPIKIAEIDSKTLAQWLNNQKDNFLLLDVREPYEREICHIGGRLVPLRELETHLANFPKDKYIICYCKSGQRGRRAVRILMENGFTQVINLRGGIMGWRYIVDSSLIKY